MDDATSSLEEESRLRAKAQADLRNAQADLDQAKEQLDEEQEGKAELQKALAKANNEVKINLKSDLEI